MSHDTIVTNFRLVFHKRKQEKMACAVANSDLPTSSTDKWLTIKGEVTENNLSDMVLLNEALKPHRIRCFQVAIELLEKIGVKYFISDGTLLAAYRDEGKFIPHDTDTDISLMEEDLYTVWKNRHLLPKGYRWQTKCPVSGIEWCDETGSKPFDPATKGTKKFKIIDTRDYSYLLESFSHNPSLTKDRTRVFTDLYTYSKVSEDPPLLRLNWARNNLGVELKRFRYDWIFPRRRFIFEGLECWGPKDPESWLVEYYGYIGKDAYFDPDEKIWKKKKKTDT